MGNRRMFSKAVTETDSFYDMPAETQALYFHLGMNVDDDGFVASPKMIMQMCGASNEDMKALVSKKYIVAFKSGVVAIVDHHENNLIRADRYRETRYVVEKSMLTVDENGRLSLGIPNGNQNGNQMATQDKLSKVKLSKETFAQNRKRKRDLEESFSAFWSVYPRKVSKQRALTTWMKLSPDAALVAVIIAAVKAHAESSQWVRDNGQYIPHPSTWLNQCRWEDELDSGRMTDQQWLKGGKK